MDDLIFHELVEFSGTLSIGCWLAFLGLHFSRGTDDLFFIHLLFDPLLVFVSDLLSYPLLRVKHEPIDALRHLLFDAKLLLPPLKRYNRDEFENFTRG